MKDITLEQLLEAGCHFGHQVTRQNPKARNFIFEARDNIHIIDLTKTKEGLDSALEFIKNLASRGGTLLVAGTKRQAKPIIEEEIKRVQNLTKDAKDGDREKHEKEPQLFYVTNRWIGGTLTNASEVVKNYKKLKELEKKLQDEDEKAKYTKREIGLWEKEKQKLLGFYGGTADMTSLPDALFIVDTHNEDLAVKEAMRMNITTVGVVDTNSDPYLIDYPIPANDDAVGSIKLIVSAVIDAWVEGVKANKKTATTEDTVKVAENTEKISAKQSKISAKTVVARKPATTEDTERTEGTVKKKRKITNERGSK